MNLTEIWIEWKKLEFWTKMSIYGTFGGLVLGALSLSGVHMQLIDMAFLFLLGSCLMLIYGNIQQGAKLTKVEDDLSKVDARINQATKSVYDQKREEIARLETDILRWKDKANDCINRLDVCERDRDQWKEDCKFLHRIRDDLMTKNQRLQEDLQRCYESDPSLNPTRTVSLAADIILRSSTEEDIRLADINRRL